MRPGHRSLSLVLCGSLLLASTGCQSGQEVAQESSASLYPGMTMEEVTALLGPPAQIVQLEGETHWIYRFEGGPTAVATVFLVILFVAVIAVMMMSKSGGSLGGGGGGSGPPCQVRIRFDADGRLIDYTPPHPVPGR
jgi:outer membrane protein assembly factor BamE (lipoprotein component of BamABCDE complex)